MKITVKAKVTDDRKQTKKNRVSKLSGGLAPVMVTSKPTGTGPIILQSISSQW